MNVRRSTRGVPTVLIVDERTNAARRPIRFVRSAYTAYVQNTRPVYPRRPEIENRAAFEDFPENKTRLVAFSDAITLNVISNYKTRPRVSINLSTVSNATSKMYPVGRPDVWVMSRLKWSNHGIYLFRKTLKILHGTKMFVLLSNIYVKIFDL